MAGFRHLDDREVARLDRIRVVRGRFEAPDGSTFERDVVRNQAVVAVVPVLDDDGVQDEVVAGQELPDVDDPGHARDLGA